ncbi:MFS transporter [Klebsiella pneumoniae]|nr:MFS transporter [Klebsiella pneumoniae]
MPLILSAVLFSASAWWTAVASHFDMFVVYRIVGGVGIGLASALSPALHCRSQPGREKRTFCRGQSAHHRDWRAGRSVNQSDDC